MPVERSSHPVAIVTGGSRGIGAAAAAALVACGYRVIITGRDHDRLKVTADRIGAEFAVADVTEVGSAERVVDETFGRHRRIDVVVNNAGISGDLGPLAAGSVQAWWAVLEVNLYGPMAVMHAALGHMIPTAERCHLQHRQLRRDPTPARGVGLRHEQGGAGPTHRLRRAGGRHRRGHRHVPVAGVGGDRHDERRAGVR